MANSTPWEHRWNTEIRCKQRAANREVWAEAQGYGYTPGCFMQSGGARRICLVKHLESAAYCRRNGRPLMARLFLRKAREERLLQAAASYRYPTR